MQRTLVMIRHAKSSWANPLQSDFDRPLNERGKREAPEMAEKLKEAGIMPDLIICSTAKRTRQTAKRISEVLGYDLANIRWEEKLYHCIPSVFEELLYEVSDKVKTVFIIAHNPGITEFVNQLSPDFSTDNMPPCGMVATRFKAEEWNRFPLAERKVILFEYPEKKA
ncbi:phosphohistidine phosphatase [Flavipsychrobacter stenotrophus]|uniref:Phosphohistidine phosphatase n=1 Tax=Flavipsychrobacter stenotrophus TaxID=2077091 RepID=A0A2S7SW89_9BACT|nr:histidine phosphatase family protein [Flavipsychrobacter stenotrophus]PQJ10881.1 phosphohistidine phosphatase [Flavipsychrobacter stenotrophus]